MNSKKKEAKNKKLYRSVMELDELRKITWNAPWIKLPKPIQIGWIKKFQLRDDCKNRQDSHIYRKIMEHVQVPVFCRKQHFIDKKGQVIKPGIKLIRTKEWNNLGWPDFYKKYFYFGLHEVGTQYGKTHYDEGYKFIQRFYFVDYVIPRFVTHEQAKLPEVETRIRELEKYIENNGGWEAYYHYKKGRTYKDRDYNQPRFDMVEELKENEIREILKYNDHEQDPV